MEFIESQFYTDLIESSYCANSLEVQQLFGNSEIKAQ